MFCAKKIGIVLLAVLIYLLRYFSAVPHLDEGYAGSYIGQILTVRAEVLSPPEEAGSSMQFSVKVTAFKAFDEWYPLAGTVLVSINDPGGIDYGDTIEILGELLSPISGDPRIAAYMKNPSIRVKESGNGNVFIAKMFQLKRFLIGRLGMFFPEPEASFASGILVGARNTIPKTIIEDFKRTGLSHILAISGYNIVILIGCVSALLAFLPRKMAYIAAILIVASFTVLVGASASVVRAAIMGSLVLVSKMLGRSSSGLRTLCVTGYAMILLEPFILIYDVGFQLSFGATAGILLFAERIKGRLQRIPEFLGIRDSLATTWAAEVFTLPIVIYYFNGFSIVSSVSNIVVLPFVPLLMLGSSLSLIFGKIVAAPTYILFKAVIFLIHFMASVPYSWVEI